MIDVPSLIDIVHGGIESLTESDKANIRYEIKQSGASRSLYLYKAIKSTGRLNILRISDHLPSMQTMVRSDSARPSAYSNANVSIDFYIPKKEEHIGNATGKKTIRNIRNRFDNHVGVPSSIPAVEPFTVSSYEYFYKNLEQKDEMIIWHCIATWICCLDPDKAYHDPFAQDETKRARFEMKTANVKVFGDRAEIAESGTTENMKVVITENDLRNIVRECVRRIVKEHYEDNSLYGWNAVERTFRKGKPLDESKKHAHDKLITTEGEYEITQGLDEDDITPYKHPSLKNFDWYYHVLMYDSENDTFCLMRRRDNRKLFFVRIVPAPEMGEKQTKFEPCSLEDVPVAIRRSARRYLSRKVGTRHTALY